MLARTDRQPPSPADIADAIAAATPKRLVRAETAVRELRDQLAEANADVRSLITARERRSGTAAVGAGAEVTAAEAIVKRIEADLKPARVELHDAREAAVAPIREALDAILAGIAVDLTAAADLLARPAAALIAVNQAIARRGLTEHFRRSAPPDPEALRALARSVHRAAADEAEGDANG